MRGWALTNYIIDQEDESIWKILAMENSMLHIGFTTQGIFPQ